ncbi:alpha/beta fold hydrolase [Roseicella frigidaeris]|uniref:alpha/beta fold hydrolase n=1 Tax=Roseicella frigidaeris TaxID=2230885 RepID=UPI001402C207|nr:alpha/beta fold hydrolase [Roseicella frigidaeris]
MGAALCGCTPVVIPAGPPTGESRLDGQTFVMADGARLPVQAWLPAAAPRAVLVGLHGFGDYSRNAFELPAPAFTAAGIALYAYDQRGFGAAPHRGFWPGTATLVADCHAVTRLVAARHPSLPVFLMGESMGAAVVLVAAQAPGAPPVQGCILLAPGIRGRASMSGFSRTTLEIASRLIPAVGFSGAAPGFSPSDNQEALRRWSRDPLTAKEYRVDFVYGLVELMDQALQAAATFTGPALLLYGAHDRIVPKAPMRRLLETLPQRPSLCIAYYREGHHLLLRDLDRATVIHDLLAWMADPAAPLPSQADLAAAAWLAKRDEDG